MTTIYALERTKVREFSLVHFAIAVCAFFFYFRFVYSSVHFRRVKVSSLCTTQSGKRFWLIPIQYISYYFELLEILYVCTIFYIFETFFGPGFYEWDRLRLLFWRKNKLFVLSFSKFCALLPITSSNWYAKNQNSSMNNWKKIFYIK